MEMCNTLFSDRYYEENRLSPIERNHHHKSQEFPSAGLCLKEHSGLQT